MADWSVTVREGDKDGVLHLYTMMLTFLDDWVKSTTLAEYVEKYDVTDREEMTATFKDDGWKEWLGFLVCLAVGVAFVFFFSLIGCCYGCCCCCCCCCKGKKKTRPKPCKTITCGSILWALGALMLAGVALNFVVATRFVDELEGKTTTDIANSLKKTAGYLETTVNEVYTEVLVPTEQVTASTLDSLNSLGDRCQFEVGNQTGVYPSLYHLDWYTDQLPALKGNFNQIDLSTSLLQQQAMELSINLTERRFSIDLLLGPCGDPCNGSLTTNLNNLITGTNYTEIANMTSYEAAVEEAINDDLINGTQELVDSFNTIAGSVNMVLQPFIFEFENAANSATNTTEEMYEQAEETVNKTVEKVDNISAVITEEVQGNLNEYTPYVSLFLYTVSGVALLVSILIVIAVPCIGSVTCRPHGRRMLSASILFTFMFGWLFMLLTTIFFASGGFVEVSVCRHLRTMDESADIIFNYTRSQAGIDNPLENNLTVRELFENCKNNQSIYSALRLNETEYNISWISLEGSAIEEVLKNISNLNINVPDVTVWNQEVSQTTLELANATSNISFQSVYDALKNNVTVYDLKTYANELYAASDVVSNSTVASDMAHEADLLMLLYNITVLQMEVERAILNISAITAENITATDLHRAEQNLRAANATVNSDADTIVNNEINETCIGIYKDLNDTTNAVVYSIEQEVGQCYPLYDSAYILVYTGCAYLLHPYNALWFTYGWFIAIASIALWFSSSMVKTARKLEVTENINKVAHVDDAYSNYISLSPTAYGSKTTVK